MSPLALFYFLMASPIFAGRFHGMESPMTWSNDWSMDMERPTWNNWNNWPMMNWEESSMFTTPFESMTYSPMNWLHTPVTRRSIVRELLGAEHPFESTHTMSPIRHVVKMHKLMKIIRRIAEVNPIMVEKILSCPETRFVLSKVLRHVEPETLVLVEKMIKKTIPSYIREKVTRRVLKNLVRSNIFSSKRSSILSELFPTTFEHVSPIFSKLFSEESPIFSNMFSEESPIFSNMFSGEFSPIFSNIFSEESPIFSNIFSEESPIFSNIFSEEFSPRFSGVYSPKKVSKIVKKLLKNVERRHHTYEPVESLLMSEVKPVEKVILKKLIKKVVRNPYTRVHFCNVCMNVCTGYSYTTPYTMPVCRVCHEVCPMTMTTRFPERLSWF